MTNDLYVLVALAARYWFVALILTILFRGWRMTVADNRRAKLLRAWMGQTGCVGEWIASPGSKKRVSYPIPREGVLGSARSADVRIRHRDMRRAHAHFELREGGLLVKPMGRAQLSVGGGHTGAAVFLQDGDVLSIGRLQLMLVLFDAPVEESEEADEWFEVAPDAADGGDEADWFDEPTAPGYPRQASVRAAAPAGKGGRARAFSAGAPILPGDAPLKPRKKSGAKAPARRRARGENRSNPGTNGDGFNEEAIWRDL